MRLHCRYSSGAAVGAVALRYGPARVDSLKRIGTVVAVAAAVVLGACGTEHADSADARAARVVAGRFFAAQARADGQAFCALLSPSRRAFEDRAAHKLGPGVTCAEAQSAHPPGIGRRDLAYINKARRAVAGGTRIESVTVQDSRAVVSYSAPALDKATLRPSGGRRPKGKLYLSKVRGQWRLDVPPAK
jgi:hypothetical protein